MTINHESFGKFSSLVSPATECVPITLGILRQLNPAACRAWLIGSCKADRHILRTLVYRLQPNCGGRIC